MLLFLEYDGDPVQDIEYEPSEELLDGVLHEFAEKLGQKPLEAFLSVNEEEFDDEQTQWFDPQEAIKTIDALLPELEDAEEMEDIIDNLSSLRVALDILNRSGCRFYLTMD